MEYQRQPPSDKEQLFVNSYLTCLNKAAAAKAAGYSKATAKQQGYEIYNKPHIKAYIEAKLAEQTITAAETVKLVSDIARASLTDYFKPVKVMRTKKVKVPLASVIKQKQDYLTREYQFIERKGLTGEEFDAYMENLQFEQDQILRLEIELDFNPKAYRIVDSEAELVEEMQLDINALVADKERGKVKKIKYGRDGLEVEMYDASAAQDKLMKMHGKYEKDNEQSKVTVNPTTNITVVSSGIPLASSEKDVSDS
jgi:phage terminase small subunit